MKKHVLQKSMMAFLAVFVIQGFLPALLQAQEVEKKDQKMNVQEENIRIVQQLYSAFGKHDIKAIMEMLSPDIEWGEPSNPFNPASGTRRGHAGFLEWLNIGRQAEEILVLEPRKMLTDSDSVAVFGYMKCRAIPTGKVYESDFVHFATIKDGTIVKFQEFFDTYVAGEAFRK